MTLWSCGSVAGEYLVLTDTCRAGIVDPVGQVRGRRGLAERLQGHATPTWHEHRHSRAAPLFGDAALSAGTAIAIIAGRIGNDREATRYASMPLQITLRSQSHRSNRLAHAQTPYRAITGEDGSDPRRRPSWSHQRDGYAETALTISLSSTIRHAFLITPRSAPHRGARAMRVPLDVGQLVGPGGA